MLFQPMRLAEFDQDKKKFMFKEVEDKKRANLWLTRSQADEAEKDFWSVSRLVMS